MNALGVKQNAILPISLQISAFTRYCRQIGFSLNGLPVNVDPQLPGSCMLLPSAMTSRSLSIL